METKEIRKVVTDAKVFLEDYKMYGKMIMDAIDDLDRIDILLQDATKMSLNEALDLAMKLGDQIGPFRVFVPTLAGYIDRIVQGIQEELNSERNQNLYF